MGKKSRYAKTTPKPRSDSDMKGRLVEHIAAQMHKEPGVTVQTRANVPTIGNSTRTREIDVLLTSEVAGYRVSVAIECKNEKMPIGAPMIDAFSGKLDDVGIPKQHGIFISASGYTSGAIERATQAGIRPLILQGLTRDALASEVAEAFQSFVYLLPQVSMLSVPEAAKQSANFVDVLRFYNQKGQICGIVPHMIWEHWMGGKLPSMLGVVELSITIPDGWYQIFDGERITTPKVTAKVLITGLVVTLKGQATKHTLVNAANQAVEKSQITAEFDTRANSYPVTTILTEAELAAFSQRPTALNVQIGRIPVPRIFFVDSYWPPSMRVAKIVAERAEAFERGEITERPDYRFEELEGANMGALWEPIWDGDMASLKKSDPH